MPRVRLSQTAVQRIVAMRASGTPISVIARAIPCTDAAVSYHCHRHGVTHHPRRLTAADHERIVTMRERGETVAAIAKVMGCSTGAISWQCLRLGADPPKPPKPVIDSRRPLLMMRNGFPVRRYTVADDEQLLALEAKGLNIHAIARAMGRRDNSIRGRLMTLARRDARLEAAE